MDIKLSPRAVLAALFSVIAVLVFIHVLVLISAYGFGDSVVRGWARYFHLDVERSIPTLYSSMQLFVASLLLLFIGREHRSQNEVYLPWLFLSAIFLFLTADEFLSIHERLINPLREALGTSGLLYFAWVIPYGIAVVVLAIAYSRFLFRLPRNTMWWFIGSGALFVSGAIGLELPGGMLYEEGGIASFGHSMTSTFEEMLEMIGIALFIYSLLSYTARKFRGLRIAISGK